MGDLLSPIQCPFCGQVFNGTLKQYEDHIDRHLKERSKPLDPSGVVNAEIALAYLASRK